MMIEVDLAADQKELAKYITKRIQDYAEYENYGPGEDDDPVQLITLGYYLEQTGYFTLVFDTRPDADCDGQWTVYIEDDMTIEYFPHWCEAIEAWHTGDGVTIKLPSGKKRKLQKSDDMEMVAKVFGDVIRDTVLGLCSAGIVQQLPLADDTFCRVEEFDGHYGWPAWEQRKEEGKIG